MAKTPTQLLSRSSFRGRDLCNEISEVNAWKNSGERTFGVIMIGDGHLMSGFIEETAVELHARHRSG